MYFPSRPRGGFFTTRVLIVAGLLLFALAVLGYTGVSNASVQERICTVTDKDRTTKVVDGSSSSDMRIYTNDCGTLVVADSLLDFTFSSSDTYSSIETGETYTFTTRGWRVPFLSMFPNVK